MWGVLIKQHLTFLCWHDGISSYHSHSVDSHAAFITCYFSTIRTHWMCVLIALYKKNTQTLMCGY